MTLSILRDTDLSREEVMAVLGDISELKPKIINREPLDILESRIICLLFEKPSTRTRSGFEVAVLRLGGKPVYQASGDTQLKRGEPVKDTARILGSYFDAIVARVFAQSTVDELAEHSGIPVINALSDLCHPTQALSDLFTITEVKGELSGLTMAYIGDGGNVLHSLLIACPLVGISVNAACPERYMPEPEIVRQAEKVAADGAARVTLTSDPRLAAEGADIVYTDVWVSMGEEHEEEEKAGEFEGFQVNGELLKLAKPDAVVMHCLPAHRGHEITDEVIEGPQSVVWQQGANKMYGAAGILKFLLA